MQHLKKNQVYIPHRLYMCSLQLMSRAGPPFLEWGNPAWLFHTPLNPIGAAELKVIWKWHRYNSLQCTSHKKWKIAPRGPCTIFQEEGEQLAKSVASFCIATSPDRAMCLGHWPALLTNDTSPRALALWPLKALLLLQVVLQPHVQLISCTQETKGVFFTWKQPATLPASDNLI